MKIRTILPIVAIVAIFLMSCSSGSTGDQLGNYKRRFDFAGIGRQNGASFIINGVNYLSTGFTGTTNGAQNSFTQETWKFDTTLGGLNGGNWVQVADFSGSPRQGAVGFSDGKYGYVGTGVDGNFNYFSDFHVYDPNTNKWDTIGGTKFTVANLSTAAGTTYGPRAYACAFTLNNIGYVGAGTGNNYFYQTFYKYNSGSNTWTHIYDIGTRTSGATAFTINGLGYVVGGVDGSGSGVTHFWEYHPDAGLGSWVEKRQIINITDSSFDDLYTSIVRQGAVALVIQSPLVDHKQVYFMQGQNGSALSSCWQWDPPTDQWTIQNPLTGKNPRTGAATVQLSNRGFFAVGGSSASSSTPYYDMYEYLPGIALNTNDAN